MRKTSPALLAAAVASLYALDASSSVAAAAVKKASNKSMAEKIYDKAKAELSPDLYTSYRLLDRIMSANMAINQQASIGIRSLDDASCNRLLGDSAVCSLATELPDVKREDSFLIWALQVAGASGASPNAYATSHNNRIVINKALDEAFSEDLEAKACVIAHEMAHVQQDHGKSRQQAVAEWNLEAAGKISSAVKNAHKAQKSGNFWTALAMVANAASAGLNSGMGNYGAASSANFNNQMLAARMQAESAAGGVIVNQVLQAAQTQAPEVFSALQQMDGLSASYVNRTMKDVKNYLDEVSEKAYGLSRQQETEADELAVNYMARAGLNPEGCLRVISKLHRGQYRPVADKNDSHPGEDERKAKIAEAIEVNAAEYRRAKTQLAKPAPLAYRYDSRLEVVTIYPRGQQPDTTKQDLGSAVDKVLGQ